MFAETDLLALLEDPRASALIALAALLVMVMLVGLMAHAAGRRARAQEAGLRALGTAIEGLAGTQHGLAGRLTQLAESQASATARMGERMQAQERAVSKALDDRLADVSRKVGLSLTETATRTGQTIAELRERLVTIDSAQKTITDLSARVVDLQDVLSNKQARGAFGEVQLNDLVSGLLPPSAYGFQVSIHHDEGKRRVVDCMLYLPEPTGNLPVDAKFPLDGYRALIEARDDAEVQAAARRFTTDVQKHIADIAERYIVPGMTADCALMFLPSEAVFAELHARFPNLVEQAFRRRVWIVSPTTMMATLNTVRAVLKDVRLREQAGLIRQEMHRLLDNVRRLDERVVNLRRHFDMAAKDIDQIGVSSGKVSKHGERIAEFDIESLAETPSSEGAPALQAGAPLASREAG